MKTSFIFKGRQTYVGFLDRIDEGVYFDLIIYFEKQEVLILDGIKDY